MQNVSATNPAAQTERRFMRGILFLSSGGFQPPKTRRKCFRRLEAAATKLPDASGQCLAFAAAGQEKFRFAKGP
jgi:hypothetical protein